MHLSRKVDFEAPKHEVPLRLPRKVTTMCENAHGTTTRAQSLEAPAAATQTLRACAVEMPIDDVERRECTVNSSEIAGHARAAHRSKHTCFSLTVRTPKWVHTVWGKNQKVEQTEKQQNLALRVYRYFCFFALFSHVFRLIFAGFSVFCFFWYHFCTYENFYPSAIFAVRSWEKTKKRNKSKTEVNIKGERTKQKWKTVKHANSIFLLYFFGFISAFVFAFCFVLAFVLHYCYFLFFQNIIWWLVMYGCHCSTQCTSDAVDRYTTSQKYKTSCSFLKLHSPYSMCSAQAKARVSGSNLMTRLDLCWHARTVAAIEMDYHCHTCLFAQSFVHACIPKEMVTFCSEQAAVEDNYGGEALLKMKHVYMTTPCETYNWTVNGWY